MNLCNDNHDEVCYEGILCHVCEKQKELDDAEIEIAHLKKEIEEME